MNLNSVATYQAQKTGEILPKPTGLVISFCTVLKDHLFNLPKKLAKKTNGKLIPYAYFIKISFKSTFHNSKML